MKKLSSKIFWITVLTLMPIFMIVNFMLSGLAVTIFGMNIWIHYAFIAASVFLYRKFFFAAIEDQKWLS